MSDLRELLIKQINEADAEIDTRVGSNFRDIVVNPLSRILESYQSDHLRVLNTLSLKDPELLSEEELDAVGANFLVERKEGSYHTGTIKLYYEEPVSLNIPRSTRFVSSGSGKEYETISYYAGTKVGMLSTIDANSLYSTGEIEVRSVERDKRSALNSGGLLKEKGFLNPSPQKIEVTSDISGGTQRESNASFLLRIKNTVKSSSLASGEVIKESVKALESSVSSLEVIGAGSPFMRRDLVSYFQLTPNTIEDFSYVSEDDDLSGYYKGHKAYVDSFQMLTNSGEDPDIVWPTDPDEWSTEFTNAQYKGIFKLDDLLKANQDHYNILTVPAWNQTYFDQFQKSDGARLDNNLIWTDEVRLSGSSLFLGKTPQSEEGKEIRLSPSELEQLEIDLTDGINNAEKKSLDSALAQIKEKRKPENYANLSPIVHKKINQHTGVSLEAQMKTTDGTESGEMCYITLLRNSVLYMAHDGYGIAWRKQPEFLIRLNYDDYEGDTFLRNKDIQTFEDYFGVNPVDESLVGDNILKEGAGNDQYWMFNLYLVDNNALDEEITMGTNRVWDNLNGINQYLQRSKYWIEKDTSYDFKLKIDTNLGTKGWVKPAAESVYDLKINKGPTYPNYVPSAGTKIQTGNSEVDDLDSTRGHFGIGVGQTKGYEWVVNSTSVRSIVETFPMHLFSFTVDTDKWPTPSSSFSVDYWGVGYDPGLLAQDGSDHSRTQLAIWNPTSTSWEKIGEHLGTINDSASSQKISKTFTALNSYLDNGKIHVAASAANWGTNFSSDKDHSLETYYVQLSNPDAGKKHLGNAVDIYCHAPTSISQKTFTGTIASGEVIVTEPYIQEIVEVRESLSQVSFNSSDYSIFCTNPGEAFSRDNSYKIAFNDEDDGAEVTVVYRAWTGAENIHAYLNDPENRYPATSLKEKVMPPTKVVIESLEYKGPLPEDSAKVVIKDYINSIEDNTLDKSDLIYILTQAGALGVTTQIDITLKAYTPDGDFQNITLTSDSYTIPSTTLSRFYTTVDDLYGVINV